MSPFARRLLVGIFLLLTGCRSAVPSAPPVAPEASRALAQARVLVEERSAPGKRAEALAQARVAARQALELAPDWVAPQRLLDEIDRDELLAPRALERHLEVLERDPWDPRALYLAGRLESEGNESRFRRAALEDPSLAWAHHGVAWWEARRGSYRSAARAQRRAVEAARDPWERAYFQSLLASYLEASGDLDGALEVLRESHADSALDARQRAAAGTELAQVLLRSGEKREVLEEGYLLAADLLSRPELAAGHVGTLVGAMIEAPVSKSRAARLVEVEACLAADASVVPSPERLAARAFVLAELGASGVALGLDARAAAHGVRSVREARGRRALAFAAGQPRQAVEAWLSDLPERLLGPGGSPADPRLARVVERVRAIESTGVQGLKDLGEALIACGWFPEALAVADRLAPADLDAALRLRARSAAALALLDDVQTVVESALSERAYGGLREGDAAGTVDDLDDLLEALEPHVARYRRQVPGDPDVAPSATPRLAFGPFGELAHPGPRFDALDAKAQRGDSGIAVPGLARLFAELGRFAIIGSSLQGTDGVLLPLLHVEQARGEHLGAPWSGTLAWCEGRDVRSRSDRVGGGVAGAALHEGYWVDVETLRRERDHWRRLQREWIENPGSEERLDAVLSITGRRLRAGEGAWRWTAPLKEDDRVRLALLQERRAQGAEAGAAPANGDLVNLDEIVTATAIHEEGHLCDRARFLPLAQRWLPALGFLVASGLSPERVLVRLEYRAQLVALAVVPEPRVVLANTLSTVENGSAGSHPRAYRELVGDFLVELARRVEAQDPGVAGLDGDRLLMHQLHKLDAEAVRAVALTLAREEGLVAD